MSLQVGRSNRTHGRLNKPSLSSRIEGSDGAGTTPSRDRKSKHPPDGVVGAPKTEPPTAGIGCMARWARQAGEVNKPPMNGNGRTVLEFWSPKRHFRPILAVFDDFLPFGTEK